MTYADETAALAALTNGTAIPADLRQIVVSYPNLRPAVAAYPGTDAAMLGWLRDLHDPLVDAQLAARSRPAQTTPAAPQGGPAAASAPPAAAAPGPLSPDGPSAFPATASQNTVPPQHPPTPSAPAAAPMPPSGPPSAPAAASTPSAPTVPMAAAVPIGGSAAPAATSVTAPYGPSGPAAPGQPGPPAFTPAPAPGGRGRGTGVRTALLLVAAVVLVGGGVFAAFAAGLVPGFGPSVGPAPTLAPPSPDGEPPTAPPTAITPPQTTATPIDPPPVGFACWDASEADSLAACPAPQTREQAWQYLRYVYPSLARHSNCTQADSTGKSDYQGVTVMWECELGDSLLRYRYWVDPSDAERHYGRKFADSTAGTYDVAIGGQAVTGWVKTSEEPIAKQSDGSKRYVATMWLPELQLSMSAEGNDTNAMWNAFELVRIRPLEQVDGHQLGTDPSDVPLTVTER